MNFTISRKEKEEEKRRERKGTGEKVTRSKVIIRLRYSEQHADHAEEAKERPSMEQPQLIVIPKRDRINDWMKFSDLLSVRPAYALIGFLIRPRVDCSQCGKSVAATSQPGCCRRKRGNEGSEGERQKADGGPGFGRSGPRAKWAQSEVGSKEEVWREHPHTIHLGANRDNGYRFLQLLHSVRVDVYKTKPNGIQTRSK